jgi:hypothetical protein
MLKLLSHLDFARVGHYKSILEEAGIGAFVKNTNASSVMGEVPFTEVWPELWIYDAGEERAARELLAAFDAAAAHPLPAWRCPACGEAIEGGFGECWNCGRLHPDMPEASP